MRVGVIHDWKSNWYTGNKDFADFLQEDVRIRKHIYNKLAPGVESAVASVPSPAPAPTVEEHTPEPAAEPEAAEQETEPQAEPETAEEQKQDTEPKAQAETPEEPKPKPRRSPRKKTEETES